MTVASSFYRDVWPNLLTRPMKIDDVHRVVVVSMSAARVSSRGEALAFGGDEGSWQTVVARVLKDPDSSPELVMEREFTLCMEPPWEGDRVYRGKLRFERAPVPRNTDLVGWHPEHGELELWDASGLVVCVKRTNGAIQIGIGSGAIWNERLGPDTLNAINSPMFDTASDAATWWGTTIYPPVLGPVARSWLSACLSSDPGPRWHAQSFARLASFLLDGNDPTVPNPPEPRGFAHGWWQVFLPNWYRMWTAWLAGVEKRLGSTKKRQSFEQGTQFPYVDLDSGALNAALRRLNREATAPIAVRPTKTLTDLYSPTIKIAFAASARLAELPLLTINEALRNPGWARIQLPHPVPHPTLLPTLQARTLLGVEDLLRLLPRADDDESHLRDRLGELTPLILLHELAVPPRSAWPKITREIVLDGHEPMSTESPPMEQGWEWVAASIVELAASSPEHRRAARTRTFWALREALGQPTPARIYVPLG